MHVYTGLPSLGISSAHLWKITMSTAEACEDPTSPTLIP